MKGKMRLGDIPYIASMKFWHENRNVYTLYRGEYKDRRGALDLKVTLTMHSKF